MQAEQLLASAISKALSALYAISIPENDILLQKTRKEFEGDLTFVVFPIIKQSKKGPEQTAEDLGNYLRREVPEVTAFNVVKGFLNISLSSSFWLNWFNTHSGNAHYGYKTANSSGKTVMLEYSSPNTNKPLHLGHMRNILLGYSVVQLLQSQGHKVIKSTLVNDRGIHICKSMLAWQKFGKGETPASSGMKGDHLVGKYYVEFDKAYKAQVKELIAEGKTKEEAEKQAPLMLEAQEMLRQWEGGNEAVIQLWKTMNGWVYEGFNTTYSILGVNFDQMYYESNTYLLGKELVQEGLQKGVFFKKPDGSVWIDLTADGLDEKLVLRSDGTSVYMTQDLGTAIERFKQFPDLQQLIYTVGNEQDYHFKVLFLILSKLGYAWAKECYHLSYGMVELPEGKMKSREGTVVDADELLEEMFETAEQKTKESGKIEDFNEGELNELFRIIGLGALKYFMLKVDPKKKMLFNPKESVDFEGHTGPFIQYTYARIQSILRKAGAFEPTVNTGIPLQSMEAELLKQLYAFPAAVEESAQQYDPSHVANFIYELAKTFNRFYHDCPVLKEEDATVRAFRLALIQQCAIAIKNGMSLLGITVPSRM